MFVDSSDSSVEGGITVVGLAFSELEVSTVEEEEAPDEEFDVVVLGTVTDDVVTCTLPSGATGSNGFTVVTTAPTTGAATASGPAGLLSVDVVISEFKLMLADTLWAGGVTSVFSPPADIVVLIIVVESKM